MMHKFNSHMYIKISIFQLSIVTNWSIFFSILGRLWSETVKNRFCTEHESWTDIYGQLQCQRKCELMEDCVGISYSHKDENTHYCYGCKDSRLTIATNDFSFYERPGLKIFYIHRNLTSKLRVILHHIFSLKFHGVCVWIVDCRWGNLEFLGECTKTCGGGTRKYSRKVEVEAKNGGAPCTGPAAGTASCNTQICPGNEIVRLQN